MQPIENFDNKGKSMFYGKEQTTSTTEPRLFEGKIADNYDKYLKESLIIGMMERFPAGDLIDVIMVKEKCRGFDVTFAVRLCKLKFGQNNEYQCTGIVTDVLSIGHRLSLGGFGSQCCYDEAETMERGVVEMCKKHNLMICQKINSYPFAKAVTQPNFYKD